jgi:leader peptidase (prepilin peptidase)/N-methyltransferase
VFCLLLGLCVGSFLNVCIYRLPAGQSIVWPLSRCMACETPIAWYDNIPVVSYFVLGGRCRKCGAPFSVRYMLVELAAGLLFFGYWVAYFQLGLRAGADHPAVYLAHVTLASALLVSGVIDYDRKEVYTSVTNLALAVGLAASLVWPRVQEVGAYDHLLPVVTGWPQVDAVLTGLVGAAVGMGLVNITRYLGTLAFRREAMGTGDAYLMAAIGGVLGWEATLLVFLVAPFLGLPYGLWQMARGRKGEPSEAEAAEDAAEAEAERPAACVGTFLASAAGFALLLAAAWQARAEWGIAARGLLVAGLVAFGASFLLLRREGGGSEAEDAEAAEHAAPAQDDVAVSHEVPYGPFLGLAAGVVMLIEDPVVAYFRPGVEALVRSLVG